MLDPKHIRQEPELFRNSLNRRGIDPSFVDEFLKLDELRKDIQVKAENLRNTRNKVSREIGIIKQEGKDITEKSQEIKKIGKKIKELESELSEVTRKIEEILTVLPNIPHPDVPDGFEESENVEIRSSGNKKKFSFTPRPHWEIGEKLGIIDQARAVKMSGTRFVLMKGAGAMLERALINFMLDLHTTKHGFTEILPPYLVKSDTVFATGQLPKFEGDLFKTAGEPPLYLIPTAEVPITNLYRDEIIDGALLPLRFAGYSACFRSEAGAAGRDTRGLTRVHQFNKVELISFTTPEDSYDELEYMTKCAEKVLHLLDLPYRVMAICIGDLGFSAAKKYDLEYWAPGQNRWIEVSSLSNCTDFQARRGRIRFRPGPKEKPAFVHTLNGSGLAVGRTVAAILENYQKEDGSVEIPEILRSYMNGLEIIKAR
ncbi:MAG: serine--tRNA ligase [Candidatus Eremiobacteraeota bacterium]|nr:serine--tRNA ligase [Candidatus Eremiobacteraeota bacterium]